jgi:uncharacterized protein YbaR (Trm112 family)
MDQRLLDILACPVCKGRLQYLRDTNELLCRVDRLVYPIHDGIPWLLEEEARPVASDDPVLARG